MVRALLVVTLCAGAAKAAGGDALFADVRAFPVAPGPDAPFKPSQVVATSRRELVLLDAEGHVGIGTPGLEVRALPFSEPMVEATLSYGTPIDLVCGRTRKDELECLSSQGDLLTQLAGAESRAGVKRLRFPALARSVKRLLPAQGNCLASGRQHLCLTHDLEGTTQQHRVVSFSITEPAARPFDPVGLSLTARDEVRCTLGDRQEVRCSGSGAYGLLGNGALDPARAKSSPPVPSVVQLVHGEGFFCARTGAGEVWCWGKLPSRAPLETPLAEHYPLCPLDRAATNRGWVNQRDAVSKAAEACQRSPPRGCVRDCCLGIVASYKVPVFVHTGACEEPYVMPDQRRADDPAWPEDAVLDASQARVLFSTTPTRLKSGPVVSIAALFRSLCALDGEGGLQCWGD